VRDIGGSWIVRDEVKKTGHRERMKGDECILGDSTFVERILSGEPRCIKQPSVALDAPALRVSHLYGITANSLGSRRSRLILWRPRASSASGLFLMEDIL